MSDLPYQQWYERDFASDPEVKKRPFLAQCVYRAVLQTMWANNGWLPVDDVELARLLGCHVRTWRSFKAAIVPLLRREYSSTSSPSEADNEPVNGPTYRQKRVSGDWANALERKAKNKARTAAATAERSRKARQKRSSPSEQPEHRNGRKSGDRNVDRHADRNEHLPAYIPAPAPPISTIENGGDGAPLTPHADRSVSSPGLGGRSPPSRPLDPNTPAEPHPADTMSPEARQRIADGMAALSRDLAAKLSMSNASDFPAYQHKPWEIVDAEADAKPDDDPEPGGDHPDQGELPEPERAPPGDTSPPEAPTGQAEVRGDDAPETTDEIGLIGRMNAARKS